MRTKDKWKLIYAYVISPILIFSQIGSEIIMELYRKQGVKIFKPETLSVLSDFSRYIAWRFGIRVYLPLILPPIIMRFIFPRRKFKYGIEIYFYMLLCMLLTRILTFLTIGEVIPTLGLLDSLVIYCILSYKTNEYFNILRQYRYALTFFTLSAVFIILYFTSNHFKDSEYYIFPIWEAIALCIVLNTYKKEDESVSFSSHQEANYNSHGIAEHLVNIGLAHIGRKTKTANPCITPAQTEERQSIERPFLKLLADNYNDEATRKTLAQYFMLYKEMLLFLIYAMALKKNPVLHSEVKGKLKERMSEGLSQEAIKKRNDYWRELSRTFYESDKGTQDIGYVLEAVFWDKLPKKVNPIPKCGHDSLYTIFCYISKAIAREYQAV